VQNALHMSRPRTRGSWSGPAEPGTVAVLRRFVADFAAAGGIAEEQLEKVRACVSEAVTNAVMHGYRDGRPAGTVKASAHLDQAGLTVVVTDDGMGFRPRRDSPGLGLGMPTIVALSTSMTVSTPAAGGTELRMVFALT
jgi:anti-sigma regulatory factor (Ser/Thr protein kinase)